MSFIITVEKNAELQNLLEIEIFLIDKKELSQKEICTNVYGFDCTELFLKNVTVEYLQKFVKNLVNNRRQQVEALHHQPGAIFYLWYDEQALQIRYNILSGKNRPLPFACSKIEILDSPDTILQRYLDDARANVIELEKLEEEDDDDTDHRRFVDACDFDEDEDIEHTVYVYAVRFDGSD